MLSDFKIRHTGKLEQSNIPYLTKSSLVTSSNISLYLSYIAGFSMQSFRSILRDSPGGSDGKVSTYNAGDPGSIPGSGRSPGKGNGNPLQYSCLENPMDGGVW